MYPRSKERYSKMPKFAQITQYGWLGHLNDQFTEELVEEYLRMGCTWRESGWRGSTRSSNSCSLLSPKHYRSLFNGGIIRHGWVVLTAIGLRQNLYIALIRFFY